MHVKRQFSAHVFHSAGVSLRAHTPRETHAGGQPDRRIYRNTVKTASLRMSAEAVTQATRSDRQDARSDAFKNQVSGNLLHVLTLNTELI